jgi:putative nucleotidyltransferase with HDIG domain
MPHGARRALVLSSIHDLPPLNQVARRLIGMLGNDRTSALDLDHVIRNDQTLTARVLKHANGSMYGKSRRIASLAEAVVLMGENQLAELVLGVSVIESMGQVLLPGFEEVAWDHSVDCAAAARALARLDRKVDPEVAFVAGLLHDIGLLVMARAAPVEMADVMALAPDDPLASERRHLGVNHAQVGQRLLEMWNLPPVLAEAVRLHHAPHRKYAVINPLVNVVALADVLATIGGNTLYPAAARPDPFALLKMCGVSVDRLPALFDELAQSRDEARRLLATVRGPGHRPQGTDESPAAPRVFSVFAVDALRRGWYEHSLRHLGHSVVSPEGHDGFEAPEWIIADLHGASPDSRARIERAAGTCGARLALVATTVMSAAPWRDAQRLAPVLDTRVIGQLLAQDSLAYA